MPSTAGIVASGSAQLDQWLRANLIAFDERRTNPLTNVGTLGAAGDATATGTLRLVNTGSKAFVWLPGGVATLTAGVANVLTVPDSPELRITGDLALIFRVSADDWTPANTAAFGGKDHLSTGRGYALALIPGGNLRLFWSPLGTDASAVFRTSTVAVPFSDGGAGWVAVWLDVDNGASGHDVRFYTAPDSETIPTVWDQLGSTVTTAGVTSVFPTTQPFAVGYARSTSLNWAGNIHRAIVRTSMDGADILDVDTSVLTDEGATSFTATTGQTVTINRGTGAAYKTATVLPGSAKRLFNGTSSDFLAMADVADIGAGDSCSVWALVRQWATPVSNGRYWSKWDGSSGAGWHLSSNGTALTVNGYVDDGPDSATATSAAMTGGGLSLIGFTLDRGTNLLTPYLNGTAGTAVSASSIGDLTNTEILYYGRNAANNANQAHESPLRGIYPGALTAAQWAALRDALLVPERAAA